MDGMNRTLNQTKPKSSFVTLKTMAHFEWTYNFHVTAMNIHTNHLIRLLLSRLERVSADSYWAHRASGIRGALLKTQQAIEEGHTVEPRLVERQVQAGFEILEYAGRERIRRGSPR